MFRQKLCLLVLLFSYISGILSAAARNESLIQPRIRGGSEIDIREAPFQVSIRIRSQENENFGLGFQCGGSLISENVVLTAAHCFLTNANLLIYGNEQNYVVVMGNTDYTKHEEHTLEFDIKHLSLGGLSVFLENDIALAFLDGTVPKDHPIIKPVSINTGIIDDNIICQAYGWGMDENEIYSDNLKVVDLPVINYDTCEDNSDYGDDVKIGMLCAGDLLGGPSACKGDSGGPLVCGGVQIGIQSWIEGCGEKRMPAVFTDVALYRSWIIKHIELNGATQPIFADTYNF